MNSDRLTRVWQKWRFSAPQTHLWLIKVWFSASTFVVKIATFAKPENVGGNYSGHFMVDTTIQDRLLGLGYSQLWFDSGVLTKDNLEEQIKKLDLGEDDNTEHYRYRTLTNYFNRQTSFDNNILNQILRLLQSDSDKTMAGSATLDLLRKPSLTDEQFDTVAGTLKIFGDWAIKQIDKARRQRMKL